MTIFDYVQVTNTSSSSFCKLRRLQLLTGCGTYKPTYTSFSMTILSVFSRISRQLQPNQTDNTPDKGFVL